MIIAVLVVSLIQVLLNVAVVVAAIMLGKKIRQYAEKDEYYEIRLYKLIDKNFAKEEEIFARLLERSFEKESEE